MELGLSGKRALVTGASAGLGAAIAEALAQEGVRLAVIARREVPLQGFLARHGAAAIMCDIADPDALDRGADAAAAALGGIDAVYLIGVPWQAIRTDTPLWTAIAGSGI